MANKQETWRKFLTVEVIVLIVTFVTGLIALPVSIFVQGLSLIDQAILAVLVGLAGAQLADNYSSIKQGDRIEAQDKVQREIAQVIKNFPMGQLKPRVEMVPLEKYTEGAKRIMIIARTASKVSAQVNFFHRQLERGCDVRFVVLSPKACQQNYLEAVTPVSLVGEAAIEVFKYELTSTLANVQYLATPPTNTRGKIEVRLVNYVSNLSFVVVDNEGGREKMMVELMPYKGDEPERPFIELASDDPDSRWYHYFRDICESIWEKATPMTDENTTEQL